MCNALFVFPFQGWIGTLVEWSQSSNVRLSAPASRALANLDIDENKYVKYPRCIYLLHPLHKTTANINLDVIFLHGLLGGVFITWRQRNFDTSEDGVVGLLLFNLINMKNYTSIF